MVDEGDTEHHPVQSSKGGGRKLGIIERKEPKKNAVTKRSTRVDE